MAVPWSQVGALQWPTSADWVGNVRPGWQGRLAKLRNPQESLPHTRGRRHAYWDAFRFRNLGIDLLIDSGTPSIHKRSRQLHFFQSTASHCAVWQWALVSTRIDTGRLRPHMSKPSAAPLHSRGPRLLTDHQDRYPDRPSPMQFPAEEASVFLFCTQSLRGL